MTYPNAYNNGLLRYARNDEYVIVSCRRRLRRRAGLRPPLKLFPDPYLLFPKYIIIEE